MKFSLLTTINHQPSTKNFFLARLGSGSACRSLYNGLVVWGKTDEVEGSSDLYAVKYPDEEIHPIFKISMIGFYSFTKAKNQ